MNFEINCSPESFLHVFFIYAFFNYVKLFKIVIVRGVHQRVTGIPGTRKAEYPASRIPFLTARVPTPLMRVPVFQVPEYPDKTGRDTGYPVYIFIIYGQIYM